MRSLYRHPTVNAQRCSNCQKDRFTMEMVEGKWLCRPCNRDDSLRVPVGFSARRNGKSFAIALADLSRRQFQAWLRRNRYWVEVTAAANAVSDPWNFDRMRPARAKHIRNLRRYAARAAVRRVVV